MLTRLPLVAERCRKGAGSLFSLHGPQRFSLEGGLDGLPLRVPNEGSLRPRVARTRETI
jgi:hypothetical protein